MKHMIKWLKITAGINLYLSVVMTFVFLTLLFAIVSDYNLTNADEYVRFLIKEEMQKQPDAKLNIPIDISVQNWRMIEKTCCYV